MIGQPGVKPEQNSRPGHLPSAALSLVVGWQSGVHLTSTQAIICMNASFVVLATALMTKSRMLIWRSLPALEIAIVTAATAVCVIVASYIRLSGFHAQMALACSAALVVGLIGLAVSPSLRSALKR